MSKVPKTLESLKKCDCMKCPSFTDECKEKAMPEIKELKEGKMDRAHAEAMFCAYEKSACISKEIGCICPTCALFSEYNLENNYYCITTGGK